MSEFVTEDQCKERRDSCKELRTNDCENRDGWIKNIDTKLTYLIWFFLAQEATLIIALLVLMFGRGS